MADEQKKDIIQRDYVEALVNSNKLRPDIAERLFTPAAQAPEQAQMNLDAPTPSEVEVATDGAPVSAEEALMSVEEMKSPEEKAQENFQNVAQSLENKKLAQTRHGIANQEKFTKVSPTEVFNEMTAVETRASDEEKARVNELENKIKVRESELLQAATRGIVLPPDPELDPIIEDRKIEERSLEEKAAIAAEPTQAEVDREAAPIRKQLATQKAEQDIAQELMERQKKQVLIAEQKIKDLQTNAAAKTSNSKWFQPGSISFVIAAALAGGAGVASGAGGNSFLEAHRRKMKDEMDAMKMAADEKLAAEKNYLESLKFNLQVQSQKTQDQVALANIRKIDAEVGMKLQEVSNALRATTSTNGISNEDFFRIIPRDQRETWMNVGGKWYEAGTMSSKKNAEKAVADTAPAKKSLNNLLEISEGILSGFLKPSAWKEADQERLLLVGSLKNRLFGSGVLSDKEREMALNIIPDPTAFKNAILSKRTAKLINNLKDKLIQAERESLRSAGITLPPSHNEVILQQFLDSKAGQPYKAKGKDGRAQAISELINQGRWVKE
jgi:hypothetical protein